MALLFWAMEEIRAQTSDADSAKEAALDHVADLPENERKSYESKLSNYSRDE